MKPDPSPPRRKLDRRQFLKLGGAAGAIAAAAPVALGLRLVIGARGESPPSVSPYASLDSVRSQESPSPGSSPVLLLINERSDNPFGPYLSEILRAEGLNCFQTTYLSLVESAQLDRFETVLLTEGPVDNSQAELLTGYVNTGGRVVAMRPDEQLAPIFGLKRVGGVTAEGYLQVDTDSPVAHGIATASLQYHGPADHYRLDGAEPVAWLTTSPNTRTDYPAISLHRFGRGLAVLWAFDLARSVAYTRQGNPAWANQERDGADWVRACDMFVGWVDLDRLSPPQADEQQRLLANVLVALSQETRPLPRLWYLPGVARTMLIATGDSHQNPAHAIEEVLTRVEQHGGHMSVYHAFSPCDDLERTARRAKRWLEDLPLVGSTLANPYTRPTPARVADWRARGHEFTLHPYVDDGLEEGWLRDWTEFTGLGHGPVSPTIRTHRILWTGWVETARVQATYGLRMNLDYYHWGPAFQTDKGEWVHGHFTGSCLPMKFVDEQGRILNIYQQLTQLADEHLLGAMNGPAQLDAQDAVEVSQRLLRRSLDGAYGAIVAQFHLDPFAVGAEYAAPAAHWLEGTLGYAAAQGIPIWSAAEWLRFTEVRHDANLEDVQWDPSAQRLSFQLVAHAAPDIELSPMVPLSHAGARLVRVEVDRQPVAHFEREVGGVIYGGVRAQAGPHHVAATYA